MFDPAPLRLTPTARLARNETRALASAFSGSGATAWLPPKILSFSAWLGELCADYLLCAGDDRTLVSGGQAQLLWQSIIEEAVFVGEPRVAALAQRAWRLIHEHDLQRPQQWPSLLLSEDSQRFKNWSARFRALCIRQGLVDDWTLNAELPGHIEAGHVRLPERIELAGFELPMTPLQICILDAAAAAGTTLIHLQPPSGDGQLSRIQAFVSPDDELRAAARWARAQLEEDGSRSIGVVVPDLAERLPRVESLFRREFDPPGFVLTHTGTHVGSLIGAPISTPISTAPWHISLGKPLPDWPLVSDALALLNLATQQLTQPEAIRLLRSPFLPGWPDEAPVRARTLARLAREAPYDLTFTELRWALDAYGETQLSARLVVWQSQRQQHASPAWPSEWMARFQQELSSLGFGSGRALDSTEYQVLQRWHDLLETQGALDAVADAPVARTRMLNLLVESADGAVFREQNPGVPVEVLGVEEALGSRFDALWLTTLNADTWPGSPRRDPLIPAAIQADLPRASAAGALAQARLELQALLRCAGSVEGSFAHGGGEQEMHVTGLLRACPVIRLDPIEPTATARWAGRAVDDRAPVLELTRVRGGTGVLRNQSDCPFRAFAERRLDARDLKLPRPGLDAGQRGTVVHKALDEFWRGLADFTVLAALTDGEREARIRDAVVRALDAFGSRFRLVLTPAGRQLEQRRTARVVERWLDEVELHRAAFRVEAHEHNIEMQFAGITLNGTIDRIDRLADGTRILIDYKTGRAGSRDWAPTSRIADPQLPAYAVALEPSPGAIAFAHLRPEALSFEGLSATRSGIDGVTEIASLRKPFPGIDSWSTLLTAWHTQLDGLAAQFRAGVAAVDPRKPDVCRRCHLHALCRIQERAPVAADEADGDD